MIRIATLRNAGAVGRLGVRQLLSKSRPSLAASARCLSDEAAETPKGIPYSKLTVGVPKETFPLEKRVAATPEVSRVWKGYWCGAPRSVAPRGVQIARILVPASTFRAGAYNQALANCHGATAL